MVTPKMVAANPCGWMCEGRLDMSCWEAIWDNGAGTSFSDNTADMQEPLKRGRSCDAGTCAFFNRLGTASGRAAVYMFERGTLGAENSYSFSFSEGKKSRPPPPPKICLATVHPILIFYPTSQPCCCISMSPLVRCASVVGALLAANTQRVDI